MASARETILKARLAPEPRHPRALATLLEAIALWQGRRLPQQCARTRSSSLATSRGLRRDEGGTSTTSSGTDVTAELGRTLQSPAEGRQPAAARPMAGRTFAGGVREALALARDAAKDQDVRLGGGVVTIRQFLQAGLVDEMHLAYAPVLLGAGESLLTGIDLLRLGYQVTEHVATPKATHVVLPRQQTP